MTVIARRTLVLRMWWLKRVGRGYICSYRAGVCRLGVMTNDESESEIRGEVSQ